MNHNKKGRLCGKHFHEIYKDADAELVYLIACEEEQLNPELDCPYCDSDCEQNNSIKQYKRVFEI